MWRTNFEIDQKYVPIKAIGKGAYGVVCSAKNGETGEKVRAAACRSGRHKGDARLEAALRMLR